MKYLNSKKGLSDVIATVLIILLAIAAVVIVWSFVSPSLRNSGTQIDVQTKCLSVQVKPTSCLDSKVNVQLVSGDVSKLVAIIETDGATKIGEADSAPSALISVTLDSGTTAKTARAAAQIKDSQGNLVTCPQSIESVTCTTTPAP